MNRMRVTVTTTACFLLIASSHSTKAFSIEEFDTKQVEYRIVGGDIAGSYPAFAKLSSDTDGFCGSTLIHPDILISAAHCDGYVGDNAYLGSNRIDGNDADEVIRITEERVHPRYNRDDDAPDIMLYKLSRPSVAAPVSINTNQGIPRDDESVRTIGFGLTTDGGDPSNRLLEVDVNVVAFDACNEAYGDLIENDMICAAARGKDSCQSDSGGPLLRQDGSLVGIVSFGGGCADSEFPGVYARVSGSMEFIRQGICEMSADPPSDCGNQADNGLEVGDNDDADDDSNTDDDNSVEDVDDNFDDDDGSFDDDDGFDDDDDSFDDDDGFDDDDDFDGDDNSEEDVDLSLIHISEPTRPY